MDRPDPTAASLPAPTRLVAAPGVRWRGSTLLAGGAPWGLTRVAPAARATVRAWMEGGVVGERATLARRLVDRGLLLARVPTPVTLDDLEVVVPVRDDAVGLERLLAGLGHLPVTVVDDGSRDADAVAAVARRHGARLVRRSRSGGPGAARNAGLRRTTRPLVWFCDADLVVGDGAAVARRLRAHLADPRVGAVAPRVRGDGGGGWRARYERAEGALDRGPASALVRPGGAVPFVPSACLLVRRAAVGRGFDPSLRRGEDVDLVWRLGDAGWLVRYDADVVVTHPPRGSWATWWAQREGYGSSAGPLARRHGARLAPLRLSAPLFALGLGVAGAPVAGLVVAGWMTRRVAAALPVDTPRPVAVAAGLVAASLGEAAIATPRAIARMSGPLPWVALVSRATRPAGLAVVGLAALGRLRRGGLTVAAAGALDDLAYASGLVRGAIAARTLDPLRPRRGSADRR